MTWEMIFVIVLLLAAIVSFLAEKIPTDQTAITAFVAILAAGSLPFADKLPSVEQMLMVFANPAPMTIAAMFVLSAALDKCGMIKIIAASLEKLAGYGYRWFLIILMLCVASISAFINNTPVVMVFMPVVLMLSRSMKVPASKLLIPLSYASIFGGTCTLVGTSTNILASSKLVEAGEAPISMFEIGAVGLPLMIGGVIYLFFFGDKLLPVRETLTSLLSDEERKEFITEAFVQHDSPIVGKSIAESKLVRQQSVRVLEIIRDDITLAVDDPKKAILLEGDRLVLACRPSGFAHARSIEGINLAPMRGVGLETISAHEGSIVEGVIGPRSTLVGQTLHEINFRQRFRVILIAIHRRGVNLREKMDSLRIEAGDLLLMMGTDPAIDRLRRSDDVLLLDHPPVPSVSMRRKGPAVVAITVSVILAVSLNILPIVAAALIGMVAVFFTGCLQPKEGYDAIEWSILGLIYGMLGMGLAMQTTGTADLIADGLVSVGSLDIVSEGLRPYVILAMLYFGTMVMTETLSNNATVVLMAPIALSLGPAVGVDPRPFVIATCIAASASFSTPIGYQTNTYVYGVGGYRFSDFVKIGLPLNLMYFIVSVLLIPQIWKF